MFSSAVPVYKVSNLRQATQWYRNVLGFREVPEEPRKAAPFTRMARDRVEVLFREADGFPRQSNNPWDAYVRLTGVDVLYRQIRQKAEVRRGPEDTFHGDREIEVRDRNGFVLTFGEWGQKPSDRVAMYTIHPVLAVADVDETTAWYQETLGFQGEPWSAVPPYEFAMLKRDTVQIFFQKADVLHKEAGRPFGWDVYFRVVEGALQTVYDQVKGRASVLREPEETGRGSSEFEIEDCNGYVLCFGAA